MRERGAFGFLGIILVITILFFAIETDQTELSPSVVHQGGVPVVMINGRPFDPSFVTQGDASRMVIVIDKDDLFVGENTVEFRWGNAALSTMTAELESELQRR